MAVVALFIYVAICFAMGLMAIEDITRNGLRWSIADMLKVVLFVCIMLALGRLVASA
jgi:hypothetical protein